MAYQNMMQKYARRAKLWLGGMILCFSLSAGCAGMAVYKVATMPADESRREQFDDAVKYGIGMSVAGTLGVAAGALRQRVNNSAKMQDVRVEAMQIYKRVSEEQGVPEERSGKEMLERIVELEREMGLGKE
jgi:hypothetical protein